jgi:hypothetical protein
MKKHILCAFCLTATSLWADGHGPAFGYATTVLGAGDTSVGTAFMWRSGVAMISPLLSYGVTENFQVSLSAPLDINNGEHPVGRFTAMMPGNPEVELLTAWRFHHALTGVGSRNESTLYLGSSVSTQLVPRADGAPIRRSPSIYMAAATGHISRRYYVWAGAGYERYFSLDGLDEQSSSLLGSFVLGWRPPLWDKEYPKPDLRFFWETTGERIGNAWRSALAPPSEGDHGAPPPLPAANSSGIIVLPDSGGKGVYSGPTFLYTYRSIAFQGGVLFAVWRDPNGIQPAERIRAVVGVTYFFLGGRGK